MAVAVDGDGRACRDGAAGEGAIEIQVRRRTVDLDERLRLDGRLEQPLVVELVAGSIGNEAIGGMRHHRHQGMAHRADITREKLLGRVAMTLVQRCQDDVEALEDGIAEVEPAVDEDVDLAAVQQRHTRIPLAKRGDFVGLLRDRRRRSGCEWPRNAVSGR